MWIGHLVSLASRSPTTKRLLWRGWYQFLATRYRDPGWTFMNYGYRPPAAAAPRALDPADEPDRSCIQLYDVVAGVAALGGREVLEIGCGRGGGASFVSRYLGPRRLVAVDLSRRAVALCRARFSVPGLSFEQGDAERLPFGDGSFDAVLNVESSHCYGRLPVFLGEVRRVLRPGGQFLYADFRPLCEVDGWLAALAVAGFEIHAERDLTPGVLAALDADDERKRSLIARLGDRPLAGILREFAALRGSALHTEMATGQLVYRAFVLSPRPSYSDASASSAASVAR
jgi:SAM-dependent methyltransferase